MFSSRAFKHISEQATATLIYAVESLLSNWAAGAQCAINRLSMRLSRFGYGRAGIDRHKTCEFSWKTRKSRHVVLG